MDSTGTVIITPERGRHKEIGRRLVALADNPRDIHWVTWPVAGYQVPLGLFLKFEGTGSEPAAVNESPPAEVIVADAQPAEAPKRRGRPRKQAVAEDADNNHSEEE